jgi:rhamnosyltransferase
MKVSIIIRSFNEEKHIEDLLRGIAGQEISFACETILVDSGSTDRTTEIAYNYGVRILHIEPAEFSFGRSLNRGIELANGDFCVFISAHCYPLNKHWLENLIRPFSDETIALVYGMQRGNEKTKYSEHQIFKRWFPQINSGKQDSPFCNNANAAIRRSLFLKYKFNETLTGLEDLDWAKKVISEGYYLYYAADAPVIHVHEETYLQVFRRYEREAVAMRAIFHLATFTIFDFIKLFMFNIFSDYISALRESFFLQNLAGIPAMRFCQFLGTYRGYHLRKPISGDLRQKFYYPSRPGLFNSRNDNGSND